MVAFPDEIEKAMCDLDDEWGHSMCYPDQARDDTWVMRANDARAAITAYLTDLKEARAVVVSHGSKCNLTLQIKELEEFLRHRG